MKQLIAVLFLVCAIAVESAPRPKVTQKIRYREIQKGSADLVWRVDKYGTESFTVRVPQGEWQLMVVYADGWTFPVRTVQGGEYVTQFRNDLFPFDFRLVRVE